MKGKNEKEKNWEEMFLGGVLFITDEGISRSDILRCDIPLNEGGALLEIKESAVVFNIENKKIIGEDFFENEKQKGQQISETIKKFPGVTISVTSMWSSIYWMEYADIAIVYGTEGYAVHMANRANRYVNHRKKGIFLHADTRQNLCKTIRRVLNISNENMVSNAGVLSYSAENLNVRQELINKSRL